MKNILLTGASGNIGKSLLKYLNKKKIKTTVLARNKLDNFKTIQFDFENRKIPKSFFLNIDAVIHLAAYSSDKGKFDAFTKNKYYNFPGLNLTIETLDGLIKHNGPVYDETKFKNILGSNIFKNKINYKLNPSLESQISTISDDIAYNSHDLEDGLKAKLFSINDLQNLPVISEIIHKHRKKLKTHSIDLVIRQIIREMINEMVSDVIRTTKRNIIIHKIKNLDDIYQAKNPIVTFSQNMQKFDKKIKSFLKKKMYFHIKVNSKTNFGRKVITRLFIQIKKNPKKYINIKKYGNSNTERIICDYIAGMTDRYAIDLYNQIK